MVSAQESSKNWMRSEFDEFLESFRIWRQKTFWQKLIDIICAILLVAFMFILCYLIAVGSEYGGSG